jgi:aminoglycoside phosphotransferase (APT) family kinase protein
MTGEVDRVAALVDACEAFAAPADAPVHGDLWHENVLVTPDGAWVLLDWDELRLGDPALDLAKLPVFAAPVMEARLATRVALLRRAHALDGVIDPLADHVESARYPDVRERMQAVKRTEHELALAAYRAAYSRS